MPPGNYQDMSLVNRILIIKGQAEVGTRQHLKVNIAERTVVHPEIY